METIKVFVELDLLRLEFVILMIPSCRTNLNPSGLILVDSGRNRFLSQLT